MSLNKNLPSLSADARLGSAQFDLRQDALEKWTPEIRAAVEGDNVITMYSAIGQNWEGDGVTAKRISAALRAIGDREVIVNINSPGGDFFEGVAIYNMLRQHKAKVTVNVMGIAASAASVIAMAGDDINMGEGSWLMIHNAWVLAAGNRHDLIAAAEYLKPFDEAMIELYSARSGLSKQKIEALMDAETYISASTAIKDGFATGMLDRDATVVDASASGSKRALALVDAAMAKAGYSRSARRETLSQLFDGTPSAAVEDPAKSCAGELATLIQTLKG